MSEFLLHYDAKKRLCAIGSAALTYDNVLAEPRSLGHWWLHYDQLGGFSRLRQIGTFAVEYDHLGVRPRTLGAWRLDYDRLGQRLSQIGPFRVGHDKLGARVRSIGPMTLHYQGRRAVRLELSDAGPEVLHLPESCLLAVYFALYQERYSAKWRDSV